ncbi:glutathione S-transferase family protein [Wenxinia marina]|uniref:glutathione S-transferase family protein n=1 Tax=Wenxinia marina TaxID=390641 RepID=UPI0003A8A1E1|nr:glutathione S-transferase family protein [Wenxinia marina]
MEQEMSDQSSPSTLRVFTFSPDWGLPTNGPFALKLLAWLELAGIPYEQVVENNSSKGPKGKSPWVELDGKPMGDSELIVEELSRRHGADLDEGLTPEQRALGFAWRRTFEEHYHQVLEWELLLHSAGAAYMREFFGRVAPKPVAPLLFAMIWRQFRKQLHARGIARHSPEVIAAKGRADLDALAAFLGDRPFLVADRPTTADTAVFGLLAPMVFWPMNTPVADHAKSLPAIQAYCDRMRERCFGSKAQLDRP